MNQEDIKKINFLETKIDKALEENDFVEISRLAHELENTTKILIKESGNKHYLDTTTLEKFKSILINVKRFEQRTVTNFKNYTSNISQTTKMHAAYKENGN